MHVLHRYGWIIITFAVACVVMLWRLDGQPYVNFDEAIHGEVSWEMVQGGDWVTLSYTEGPYFRKPPLKIWMTAVLMAVRPAIPPPPAPPQDEGESRNRNWIVWALRLPSAIAGIGTVLLTAWWMWEWKRSRYAALLAGLIMATVPAVFAHAFRTGEMDGLLTLFVTGALYCWWRATCHPSPHNEGRDLSARGLGRDDGVESILGRDDGVESSLDRDDGVESILGRDDGTTVRRWLLLCGAAIGLGVMTKSVGGLLPVPIIGMHWLVYRSAIRIPIRALLMSGGVFLVIMLPWHLAMSVLHGTAFWNEYLGFHVIDRITTQLHNEGAGPLWYVGAFERLAGPWFPWVIVVIVAAGTMYAARIPQWFVLHRSPLAPLLLRARVHLPRAQHVLRAFEQRFRWPTLDLLFIACDVTFIGYSLAQTKFAWYLLPMFPVTALLIAGMTHAAWQHRILREVTAILLAVTLAIAGTRTLQRLTEHAPASPFPEIATQLRGERAEGLVAYGFAWQEQPAAYFTFRTELRDVRISDGLTDINRAMEKIALKERSWLITQATTELPRELRHRADAPIMYQGFMVYRVRSLPPVEMTEGGVEMTEGGVEMTEEEVEMTEWDADNGTRDSERR